MIMYKAGKYHDVCDPGEDRNANNIKNKPASLWETGSRGILALNNLLSKYQFLCISKISNGYSVEINSA
jgi:hypothetical protein